MQRYGQSIINSKNRLEQVINERVKILRRLEKPSLTGEKKTKNVQHKINRLEKEIKYLKEDLLKGREVLPNVESQATDLNGFCLYDLKKNAVPVAQLNDNPIIVPEKRLGFTFSIRRYPTDLGIDHSHEAGRIFSSTQIERLLDSIGRILRSVGFEAKFFDQFRYASNNDAQEIYRTDNTIELHATLINDESVVPEPK